MLDTGGERKFGLRELATILLVAAAIAAAVYMVGPRAAPSPGSNAAEEAARAQVEKIYQEELAAAKLLAMEQEAARQADLNATEEFLNSVGNPPPAPANDTVAEAEGRSELPAATEVIADSTFNTASDPSNPGGSATTDGQTVNVQALIDSVKAPGAKREKNE